MSDPRRAEELLARAEELPAAERESFLRREAAGDEELLALLLGALDEGHPAAAYFESVQERVARAAAARLEEEALARLFDDRDLPRRLGAYRLLRELGRGGMGTVYLAEREVGAAGAPQSGAPSRVAVKVLHDAAAGAEVHRRFVAERRILASLDHPGIARLLDGGVTSTGVPYLVMELVEGVPLLEFCDRERLGIEERLELFEQVCGAVEYAHGRLVVHRDLKPGNILVARGAAGADAAGTSGRPSVKLVDFGIAKILSGAPLQEGGATLPLTRTGVRLMTPEYAAPEQLSGGVVTVATDVYALGVVLYELLVGVRPFEDDRRGPLGIELAVLETEPARPSSRLRDRGTVAVGGTTAIELAALRRLRPQRLRRRLQGDLDTICLTALRKEPTRRYSSVSRLREDLERHRLGLPVAARPDTLGYRARKFVGRHRLGVAVTAAVIGLLLAGVLLLLRQNAITQRERDKAERVAALLVDVFGGADPSEARGGDPSARELLDRGAARVLAEDSRLDDQPGVRAALLDVLGRVYGGIGDYRRGADLLERALVLRRGETATPRDLVSSLLGLGELRRHRGELAGAEPLLREALERSRAVWGDDSAEVAAARDALGKLHVDQGRLEEATAALELAVSGRSKHFGRESAEAADSLNNLAAAKLRMGDLEEAQALFEEALRIRRERLGADHPVVPATLNNLASALDQRGDRAGAERAYREALDVYRRIHGDRHPRIATTLNNLGLARLHEGDLAEAEELLRAATSMRRELLSADHPDLAQGLANLGYVVQAGGDRVEAEALYREALAIRRKSLAPADPRVSQSLNNLGLLLIDHGGERELSEAEALLREALAQVRQTLGDRHPLVATAYNNLGLALLRQGRPGEARASYAAALDLRREILPAGHPHIAYALLGLGQSLTALGGAGHLREAEPLLREALEIREKTLPAGHRLVAEAAAALEACRSGSSSGPQGAQ